jgi:CTP synthase (UTP-ammonia lyase)
MYKYVDIAIIGDYNFKIQSHLHTNAVFRHCEEHFDFGINTFWINSADLDEDVSKELSRFGGIYLANGPYRNPYAILKALDYIRKANIPFLATDKTYKFVLIDLFENVLGFRAVKPDVEGQNEKLNIQNLVEQKLIYFDEDSQLHDCYGRRTNHEYTSESFQLDPDFAHSLKEKGVRFTGSDDDQFLQGFEYSPNDLFVSTMFNPLLTSNEAMPHPLFMGLIHYAMELKRKEVPMNISNSA